MEDGHIIANSLNEYLVSEPHAENFDSKKQIKHVKKKRHCGIRKMWLAAFPALLLSFTCGLAKGYSSPAIYDMEHRINSAIKPTEKESMWIGSILALGGVFGCFIAGPMADKLGRKDILVYNIIPHGFGWLIICYSKTIPAMLFGRFISGIAVGIIACVVPVYCLEIATVEVRGILGSAFQGFYVIGNLLSVTIGAYISWDYLALNGAIFSVLAVILFCPMPESPRWLLMKNRLPEAIKVMHDLQGGFVNAEKECTSIYQSLKDQPKGTVTREELTSPSFYKPVAICLLLMFFHEFTGINAVIFYSSDIFEISKDFMNPKIATMILGAAQVVVTLLSNLIVDKAGRKLLLGLSGSIMAISFTTFGFYYYKSSLDDAFKISYGWIPLLCCLTAMSGYSIGFGPVPYLLSVELAHVRVRSTINAITHFAAGMFAFVVTNTFSDLEHMLKNYGAFWFFSSLSVLGVLYIVLLVPETKGKSSEEIQDIFQKRKKTIESINIAVIS